MTAKKAKPHKGDDEGGFNPDRPKEKKKVQPAVGPAPTDDPYNKAKADLKERIEKVAEKWRIEDGDK